MTLLYCPSRRQALARNTAIVATTIQLRMTEAAMESALESREDPEVTLRPRDLVESVTRHAGFSVL